MSKFQLCLADKTGLREDCDARTTSFFALNSNVVVNDQLITEMKKLALENNRKNVRICLHQDPSAMFHEMIILELKENYYPPHKHLNKQESRHIIEGQTWLFFFSEDGKVEDEIILNAKENIIYRIAENRFHCGVPITDYVIYHETKSGPFIREVDSIFPPWAPGRDESGPGHAYTSKLLADVRRR